MLWLLQSSVVDAMAAAPQATPNMVADAVKSVLAGSSVSGNAARVMEVAGNTAAIHIEGVMTSKPDFMAYYFGGGNVLFGDISAAIRAAEADPAVKSVDFVFASGGGEANPTTAVGDQIAAMTKPTRAVVTLAASAAYWLASQTDEIVAADRSAMVGSIGAAISMRKPSESMFVEITSTNAPNKRPNPETPEGQAIIKTDMLDPAHELFATAVAVGRDTTVETVNTNFGKGGMMYATQALTVGMIDSIAEANPTAQSPKVAKATGAKTMDLAELQASHPALHAQVLAQGQKEGAAAELDRVKFHATMGKKTGATAVALTACINGTAKDDGEVMAEYLTANTNRADLSARTDDEIELADNNVAQADKDAQAATAINSVFEKVGGSFGVNLDEED